ncbi:MAG: YifB family Mg chelatase-like AAA ATPase [Steroidobacteraceae bacterium]
MGFAQILSRAQFGLAAPEVRVEVHLGSGLPQFSIVGLPAPVVRESKDRVRAALAHCGFEFPAGRITVNLAPADLPKEGGRFDLPIALGILLASGQLAEPDALPRTEFYGELALTGELKPVPGLLLAALHAAEAGRALVVPAVQAQELAGLQGLQVRALPQLRDLESPALPAVPAAAMPSAAGMAPGEEPPDLAQVRGQQQARRALIIAAAGQHSLLLCGPPGSGKSMLARCLPGLLPPLEQAEALEVAAIAAVAQLPLRWPPPRPFRSPHHSASAHAIVGGGPMLRPGEVSLAHRGVLFLDELPEFDRRVLEGLREPLEAGVMHVVRARARAQFPAAFQLVAAMNPCPCGCAGLASPRCRCQKAQVERYRARVSGPLLDRIDLQLQLPAVATEDLVTAAPRVQEQGLSTVRAAAAVQAARQRQLARQGRLNSQLDPEQTLEHCRPDGAGLKLLQEVSRRRGYSARSQHRVLRVARTIADLAAGSDSGGYAKTGAAEIAEALAMRWSE